MLNRPHFTTLLSALCVAGLLAVGCSTSDRDRSASRDRETTYNHDIDRYDRTTDHYDRDRYSDRDEYRASSTSSRDLSPQDNNFVQTAVDMGYAEAEIGRLAADRASDSRVKDFGQQMVDDHQRANDRLSTLASDKGIRATPELDSTHKTLRERLQSVSGHTFDREYMDSQVEDHNKTVTLFQSEANNGRDTDLRRFAQDTLPTLQDHQRRAQNLANDLANDINRRR